jgi:hypothetical protein
MVASSIAGCKIGNEAKKENGLVWLHSVCSQEIRVRRMRKPRARGRKREQVINRIKEEEQRNSKGAGMYLGSGGKRIYSENNQRRTNAASFVMVLYA